MFEELNKYQENGDFIFKPLDNLNDVCNAPNHSSGIYFIYAEEKTLQNLLYIGISGRRDKKGNIKHRKDGLRGRFLTGKTDGVLRKKYWPQKMNQEGIKSLHIYWYVTHGKFNVDFPRDLEILFLTRFVTKYKRLPRWNREI